MKKRIKYFSPQQEEKIVVKENDNQKDFYLKLLISDLKKEVQEMPKYSLWSEMVNKFLIEEKHS